MELKKKLENKGYEFLKRKSFLVILTSILIISIIGVVYALGVSPAVNYPKEMTTFYKFNNVSANGESYAGNGSIVFDYSNYLNNATIGGDIFYNQTGGPLGDGAFEFDGINDYIVASRNLDGFDGVKPFSIAGWIKIKNVKADSTTYVLTGLRATYPFVFTGVRNGKSYFRFGNATEDDAIQGLVVLQNDTWYNIVGTFDGTTMRLYENGLLKSSTGHTTLPSFTSNLTIGSQANNGAGITSFSNSSIDNVIFYNSTLSAQDVLDLYQTYQGCYPTTVNWNIDSSLNCTYNGNYVISGNLTLTGTGKITINGNFTFNSTNQYIFANQGSQILVNRGGSLSG